MIFYLPEKEYKVGEKVQFPALNWAAGEVKAVREGNNPELPGLMVMTVELDDGGSRQFAYNIADHALNISNSSEVDNSQDVEEKINETFGMR